MGAINPRTSFPAASFSNGASTAQLSTGTSVAVAIATTLGGARPAYVRVSVSAGAAYVIAGTSTAVTAITSGTIVTSTEALWMNTNGLTAVAFLQTAGGVAFGNVASLEEGAIRVPTQTSASGNTSGLG